MKKLLIAIIAFYSTSACFGQTDQGDFLVGGSFGFRTNKNNSNFNFSPNGGYFVANNFAVGANVLLNFSKDGDVKTSEIGLGPFVRYYLGKTTVRPFLISSIGFTSTSTKSPGLPKINPKGYYFLAGLGYAAFISDDLALEGIAGYNYTDYKNGSSFNGFSLNFGFQIYLNRRKIDEIKTGTVQ
jgi:hypothetical protein